MNVIQADERVGIGSRIKEAEMYRSMGLLMESMDVYKKILSDAPELDPQEKANIKDEIGRLKKEIVHLEKDEPKKISKEDLSIIKKALSIDENVSTVLDSASSFKELGLFGPALSEYENLFQSGYPHSEIIPQIVECNLNIHSPANTIYRIKKMIHEKKAGNVEHGEIAFIFGMEMEQSGHNKLALELYKYALEFDPKDKNIIDKIKSISPTISTGSKYEYLLNKKMVTTEQLKKALAISKKARKSVEHILMQQFHIRKEEIGKSLSLFYGYPFKAYDVATDTPVELITNLKESFLLNYLWVPLSWDKSGMEILIDDPKDLNKTDSIKALMKTKKIILSVGIREDIEEFIKRFFHDKNETKIGQLDISASSAESFDDFIPDISFEEEEEPPDEGEEFTEASGQVVKLVDHFIIAAYRKNASDIHIEPSIIGKNTTVRFRVDGLCYDFIKVPNSMASGLISRLKIMAGLDISERRLPQDGKIKFKRKNISPFELRIATYPTAEGFEDAVLRILPNADAMKIEGMGLSERNLKVIKKLLSLPYGLMLAVGPTGSGKTTSLHAALRYINKPDIKILTAEDPVEITQPGLRQVEANPKIGLTFARIMRSFLRSDPDVIMIGEMRDEETASISIEASLTGHLVFSTLHTNSAPETITRLLDMGLNPINFSDAFLGVLAQRLIRTLCPECRKEYHPSREEFEEIMANYGKEYFETTGIEYTSDLTLYRSVGCEKCSNAGYKGRIGIHELMEGTPEIKGLIRKQATSDIISKQAMKEGMTTLMQDGILKVFQGLSDMREVRRVCIN